MIRALGAALALIASAAGACPEPSDRLVFHSCWGTARAGLLVLPESALPPPETDARLRLIVSGAYTGRDSRDGDKPNPVGLFLHRGRVINPNLARMDGILMIAPEGASVEIAHRARVPLGPQRYDLRDPETRSAFRRAAAERGLSVMQSHLLIVDGRLDVSPRPEAPKFVRRMLFTDAHGYGLYQTAGPATLHAAAQGIAAAVAPGMALNLDMGSFDFCLRAEAGQERRCGLRGRENTARLSNLLVLELR